MFFFSSTRIIFRSRPQCNGAVVVQFQKNLTEKLTPKCLFLAPDNELSIDNEWNKQVKLSRALMSRPFRHFLNLVELIKSDQPWPAKWSVIQPASDSG